MCSYRTLRFCSLSSRHRKRNHQPRYTSPFHASCPYHSRLSSVSRLPRPPCLVRATCPAPNNLRIAHHSCVYRRRIRSPCRLATLLRRHRHLRARIFLVHMLCCTSRSLRNGHHLARPKLRSYASYCQATDPCILLRS